MFSLDSNKSSQDEKNKEDIYVSINELSVSDIERIVSSIDKTLNINILYRLFNLNKTFSLVDLENIVGKNSSKLSDPETRQLSNYIATLRSLGVDIGLPVAQELIREQMELILSQCELNTLKNNFEEELKKRFKEYFKDCGKKGYQAAKKQGYLINPNIGEIGAKALKDSGIKLSIKSRQQKAKAFQDKIRPIIEGLNNEGIKRVADITRTLNRMGIKTPRGGQWYTGSVSRLLKKLSDS